MAIEAEISRRLFTVEEYHRMAEAGIFHPDERIELIEGEIVQMSPIGPRHAGCVINVNRSPERRRCVTRSWTWRSSPP